MVGTEAEGVPSAVLVDRDPLVVLELEVERDVREPLEKEGHNL